MQGTSRAAYGDPSTSAEPVAPSYVAPSLAGQRLDEIERRAILDTLRATSGNKAKTSRMLGVSEKTIYNKLKQYRMSGTMSDEWSTASE